MASPSTPNRPETEFTHSVRGLTRLSSEGDYVVVEREASCVLQSATRIKKSQSPYGLFYEVYHSAKSKARSLLSARPQGKSTAAVAELRADPINSDPYDTSDWDDEQSDKVHYIHANNVARYVSYVGQIAVIIN